MGRGGVVLTGGVFEPDCGDVSGEGMFCAWRAE